MKKRPKPSPFAKRNSRRFSRAKRERMRAAKSETRREKRAKSVFRASTKAKFLRQNFFLLSAKNRTKTRTKLCFMKKKHFFLQKFFTKLRKSPYFWGKKRCLLKKGTLVGRNPSRFFQKANTPSLVSYACITFSASWVALCCWGSPSPRRCAPVRPPHGGAFAPSGRSLAGRGRPCKRRKKRLHAYACEAVVHPTDTCRFSRLQKFLYNPTNQPAIFFV